MSTAPGWAFRSQSPVATGTTSLTITAPVGIVDDDILVLGFTHKGAGFGVVPAGFSLVERVLQGTLRTELYWKRASSESGTYSVTGLATQAIGAILAYEGGLESGQVVDVSSAQGTASGAFSAADGRAPSMLVTQPHALLVFVVGLEADINITRMGCDNSIAGQPIDHIDTLSDPNLFRVSERVETASGTGRLMMGDAMKVLANQQTGWMYMQASSDVASVCIMAALTPRTTPLAGNATKYYLSTSAPRERVEVAYQGSWQGQELAPTVGGLVQRTLRMSQLKGALGQLRLNGYTSNQVNLPAVTRRWMSPPLQAQTISGTVDWLWLIARYWEDRTLGKVDQSVIYTRLHVYVSKGETGEVRGILLNNHEETANWPFSAVPTRAVRGLATPATLTAATCQDGDTICVEPGLRVVSADIPLLPQVSDALPDEFTVGAFTHFGGAYNEGTQTPDFHAGVPYLDAVLGVAGELQVPHLLFSQAILERAPETDDAIPTNSTYQTAEVVDPGSVQHGMFESAMVDTSRIPAHQRVLWFSFTPAEAGTYLFAVYGSNNVAQIAVFEDFSATPAVPLPADGFVQGPISGMAMNNALDTVHYTLVADRRYWVAVRNQMLLGGSGPDSGGATRLTIAKLETTREIDDILYGGLHTLAMDSCGNIKAQQPDFTSNSPTGIAVDYRQVPMADLTDPSYPALTNAKDRVYVGLHHSDIIEIVDADDLNAGRAEVDWIADFLEDKSHHGNHHFITAGGKLYTAFFGNGYWHVSSGGVGVGILAVLSDPGHASTDQDVQEVPDATNGVNQAGWPFAAWDRHVVPVEVASPSCIALAQDDARVLYYTSPPWYLGVTQRPGTGTTTDLRAMRIQRWDLEAKVALSDVATITPIPGDVPTLKGLFALPAQKGILVCAGSRVLWVSLAGDILRIYRATPRNKAEDFCSVWPTVDVRSFWAMDHTSGYLFEFDLFTTAQKRCIPIFQRAGVGSAIALWQPNGLDTPCW